MSDNGIPQLIFTIEGSQQTLVASFGPYLPMQLSGTLQDMLNIIADTEATVQTAVQSANTATTEAGAATTSANNAASSAAQAQASATTAGTQASNASSSASAAANSATQAAGSASASATSATNSANSAAASASSASAASTSATNASNSSGAASTSATNAANSATAASASASSASTSESNANTSATNAANSASAASTSASNAAGSATSASNSASTATTQASNASTSATNAANSATAAANSAASIALPIPVTSGGTGSTSASAARTSLGLGTAATVNTGTSGGTVPLLNGANTFSASQTLTLSGVAAFNINDTSGSGQTRLNWLNNGANVWGLLNSTATNQWQLNRYVSGSLADSPITVSNSTGLVTVGSGGLSVSGGVSLNYANPTLTLNASAAGQTRWIGFSTNNSLRWYNGADNSAESGSNAGSNWLLARYNDSGVLVDQPIVVNRATGVAAFTQRPTFNGNTAIDIGNIAANTQGRLINVRVFTLSGTYTPTAGTNSIIVDLQGAGAGSAGLPTNSSSLASLSGPGATGGFVRHRFTSGFSGLSYIVGAAGAAGAAGGGTGGTGGSTTFGSSLTAGGGQGAVCNGNITNGAAGSGVGGAATGGNILNIAGGGSGAQSWVISSAGMIVTASANPSSYGGFTYGYGGAGIGSGGGSAAVAGITGGPGVIVVWEYA